MLSERLNGYSAGGASNLVGNLPSFVELASTSLEALLVEQAQRGKEVARALRNARREKQMRLVKAQVAKLKEAAEQNIWAVCVGTAAKIACNIAGYFLGGSEKSAGFFQTLLKETADAAGTALATYNWHHLKSAEYNARATEHGASASLQGQLTQNDSEMLESARQVEQAMLRHLEKITDSENASSQAIVNKLGS